MFYFYVQCVILVIVIFSIFCFLPFYIHRWQKTEGVATSPETKIASVIKSSLNIFS